MCTLFARRNMFNENLKNYMEGLQSTILWTLNTMCTFKDDPQGKSEKK